MLIWQCYHFCCCSCSWPKATCDAARSHHTRSVFFFSNAATYPQRTWSFGWGHCVQGTLFCSWVLHDFILIICMPCAACFIQMFKEPGSRQRDLPGLFVPLVCMIPDEKLHCIHSAAFKIIFYHKWSYSWKLLSTCRIWKWVTAVMSRFVYLCCQVLGVLIKRNPAFGLVSLHLVWRFAIHSVTRRLPFMETTN